MLRWHYSTRFDVLMGRDPGVGRESPDHRFFTFSCNGRIG